ncbi:MAG: DUF1415 domain-containing protein [Chitinophagaceae bacterium]|nr:DUF1415 domain-containing protein [Chitinophagaceae bacterium]
MLQNELLNDNVVIEHTKSWIIDVVVGCNFCPFAAREIQKNSIYYQVLREDRISEVLERLILICEKMEEDKKIETAFLVFPTTFLNYMDYLDMLELAMDLLSAEDYDGIFQLASFHPDYCFAGATNNDPANYTNRSPYPMLHILREESIEKAIENHPDIENVPNDNIAFAKEKGLLYMEALRNSCIGMKN